MNQLPTHIDMATAISRAFKFDGLTATMLGLVGFIAFVIVRYSRTYLAGDPGMPRYWKALFSTLSAVIVVVVANNLVMLALGWLATSLSLHHLLTYYHDRKPAMIAAHKKFLVSRLADICLGTAIAIIFSQTGTVSISELNGYANAHTTLSPALTAATVLLALCVMLKTAQLPFHGWIIQVMEAPTPVSALLHAGVVNIGGFVMIRLAPLMSRATLASTLLVVVGTITAVAASLVMTTRVSIKVALAWSTCAQMGFMLIECGVGAWHLALLHLVAHSLYKAHAFLSSASTVDEWRAFAWNAKPKAPSIANVTTALAIAATIGVACTLFARKVSTDIVEDIAFAPSFALFCMALTAMLVRGAFFGGRVLRLTTTRAVGAAAIYLALHGASSLILTTQMVAAHAPANWAFVVAAFVLLFVVQTTLWLRPDGALARALQPQLFAGFFLDEWFTRLAFRVWPPRVRAVVAVQTPTLHAITTAKANS